MKIRLLSDLHHEHFDGRRQLPEVEADVVVLAGDIHSHLEGLHWARETFADSGSSTSPATMSSTPRK